MRLSRSTRPVTPFARTALALALALAAGGLVVAPAGAGAQHDVRYLSSAGLDFIAEQVPSLVPPEIFPPELSKELLCMTATQRDTRVALTVDDFSLTIPSEGKLRLYIALSAQGEGELFVEDAVACLGSLTCQDQIIVNDARATIDFDVMLEGGKPSVVLRSVDLQLSEDDIDLNFSGCVVGDIANVVIDFAKKYVTDSLLAKAEEMARDQLGPAVEEMLSGIGAFEGTLQSIDYTAALQDILVLSDGIFLGATADLTSTAQAAECVAEFDGGEPATHDGQTPDLAETGTHLALALNLGLADDALYHAWRSGLTCLTGGSLEALGIHLPLDHMMELIPGFPPGSTLETEARITSPPRVTGAGDGEDASVEIVVDGIAVSLIGRLPDGTERRVEIGVDVSATATVGVDPVTNALVATPDAVTLRRLEMDQVFVAETGFDVTRMMEVVEDHMMPSLLADFSKMPLTGPVFKAGQFAVILRSLGNTDAYLTIGADLFRVPASDEGAPETSIIDYPVRVVSPAEAIVRVSGVDGLIPTELLQYQVWIDGEARPLSYIKQFKIGGPGQSGTYEVEVAALDLNGNADLTPARIDVTVDGLAPQVLVTGDRVRVMDGGSTDLSWTMSDDNTATPALAPRVELFRVTDPTDALAVEHVRTIELTLGATLATVEITDGDLYRAELRVTDAVGNETVSSILLDASDDGGCAATGRGTSSTAAMLLLGLLGGFLLLRRRR